MTYRNSYSRILYVSFVFLICIMFITLASGISYADEGGPPELCGEDNGGDAAEAIRNVFFILQLLGPVFAILFYSGMSVADAATLEPKYEDKKRKVLLYGFSVPISILFLDAIASEVLITGDISCFFPGNEDTSS